MEVVTKKGPPATRSQQNGAEIGGSKGGGGVAKGRSEAPQQSGVKSVPKADVKDVSSGPQFKYQSPVEDTKLVKAVFERAMDRTVEVSQRELLALAPDLRRQLKELTTTKRVPVTGSANSFEEIEEVEVGNFSNVSQEHDLEQQGRYAVREDGTVVVAEDSLPLRCIDVVVADKGPVECILDSGSQIVAIRKEVWQRLGIPIRSDKIMMMEAANRTKTATMGVLENLKVVVGPIELRLQVQVMNDAPYDILLGRPFYSLAECVTKDFSSGEQYLTMKDPNSDKQIMVPTRRRVKSKPEASQEGFQSSRSW